MDTPEDRPEQAMSHRPALPADVFKPVEVGETRSNRRVIELVRSTERAAGRHVAWDQAIVQTGLRPNCGLGLVEVEAKVVHFADRLPVDHIRAALTGACAGCRKKQHQRRQQQQSRDE